MTRSRIELEVEYVRTEKIKFEVDDEEGFGTVGLSYSAGRVLRHLNYWMHAAKSLIGREHPRLIKWDILQLCYYCQDNTDMGSPPDHDNCTGHCSCDCKWESYQEMMWKCFICGIKVDAIEDFFHLAEYGKSRSIHKRCKETLNK